jgi:hypothetical protein
MSLKWFHIVFISLSMLTSLGFGVWALINGHATLGVLSLAGSAALVVYGNYFLGKMKILLTTLAVLGLPRLVEACPVCFGNPASAQTKGAQAGVLALLIVTVAMLASIAGFFFIYLRRRMRLFEESTEGAIR